MTSSSHQLGMTWMRSDAMPRAATLSAMRAPTTTLALAGPRHCEHGVHHRGVEGEIVESAAEQRGAAEARRPDPMDLDAADRLALGQPRIRRIVALPAGDDVHLPSAARQMKREIADDL